MSLSDLASQIDLPAAQKTARGLRTLVQCRHDIALATSRTAAIESLAQFIKTAKPGETTRRACKLLIAGLPTPRRTCSPAQTLAAQQWLEQTLAPGPLPVRDLYARARDAGFSPKVLRKARGRAGVLVRRKGFHKGSHYYWTLPLTASAIKTSDPPRVLPTFQGSHTPHTGQPPHTNAHDPEEDHHAPP